MSADQSDKMPQTAFLVVCGPHKTEDAWIFGNFLGLCSMLQTAKVCGEFWSAFPLEAFWSEGEFSDIKFGHETDGAESWRYSKVAHDKGGMFWKQHDPLQERSLVKQVLHHMHEHSRTLEAGDIYNIFLMGHGNRRGIQLAGLPLLYSKLTAALVKFQAGVEINVIIQSCKSGAVAELLSKAQIERVLVHTSAGATQKSSAARRSISGRHRNSPFSEAVYRSFIMSFDPDCTPWTLEGHISFVKRESSGPLKVGTAIPHAYTDREMKELLTSTFFTDFLSRHIEVEKLSTTPATATSVPSMEEVERELDEEWRLEEEERQGYEKIVESGFIPHECLTEVAIHLKTETDLLHDNYTDDDTNLEDSIYRAHLTVLNVPDKPLARSRFPNLDLSKSLQAFRWRFRIQEHFLLAMAGLVDLGLTAISSEPILWYGPSRAVGFWEGIVNSFTVPYEASHRGGIFGYFDAPTTWLAVMLARGSVNHALSTYIPDVLDYLIGSQVIGQLKPRRLFDALERGFQSQSSNSAVETFNVGASPHTPCALALLLPDGLTEQACAAGKFQAQWAKRYGNLKILYEKCLGQGQWGDSSEIESCVRRLPQLLRPGPKRIWRSISL